MNHKLTKSASVMLASAFLLSGCAGTADGRKTQAQGTGMGMLGGALTGALVGALTGDPQAIARAAVAGAVAGGAVGFVHGSMVAKRKEKYIAAEDWLNSEIALAQTANNSAYAYNTALKRRVAALDRRIRVAKANGNKGELQNLKAEIGTIRTEVQNQSTSEAQYEKDQGEVLGDAKAQGAKNFGQYQSLTKSFQQAKTQRSTEVGRLASLEQSIGG